MPSVIPREKPKSSALIINRIAMPEVYRIFPPLTPPLTTDHWPLPRYTTGMPTSSTIPSPWRSARHFLVRALLALLLAAALWAIWYAYAAHALARQVAAYQAVGDPTTYAELYRASDPPPSVNAYAVLVDIDAHIKLDSDEMELVESSTSPTPTYLPLTDAELRVAERMLARFSGPLANFEKIRVHPQVVWPMPAKPLDIPRLGYYRHLANLRRATALYHHQIGRDDQVLTDLADMHMTADVCDRGDLLINHLVAVAIHTLTNFTLLHIAPDFQVRSSAFPNGAERTQVMALIDQLGHSDVMLQGLVDALKGERVYVLTYERSRSARQPLLVPAHWLAALHDLQNADHRLPAMRANDYPAFRALLPPETPATTETFLSQVFDPFGSSFGWDRVGAICFHGLTDQRAAAIRLALRLYELDHDRLPPTLEDLTPQYLPKPIADPMRADGATFRYDPARRLLYSVGDNRIDDGATILPPNTSSRFRDPDLVYRLDRPSPAPPAPAPTSSTAPGSAR